MSMYVVVMNYWLKWSFKLNTISQVGEAEGKIWSYLICFVWSPVRNVAGETRAYAWNKVLKWWLWWPCLIVNLNVLWNKFPLSHAWHKAKMYQCKQLGGCMSYGAAYIINYNLAKIWKQIIIFNLLTQMTNSSRVHCAICKCLFF